MTARLHARRWVWLLPPAAGYATLHSSPGRVAHLAGGLVALGLLAWAFRRPGRALIALVAIVPLQVVGFGFLLRLHVPAGILRPAGGIKELLAVGILLSALHAMRDGRTRLGKTSQLDAIDKALLGYVAVVTLYLIFPHLFTTFPVSNRWNVRLLAWRADCGYVLLFFAVRHAPIPAGTRRRFTQVLIAMAGLAAAAGFYQWLRPDSWSYFVLITGRQIQYQLSVLGNDPVTVVRNLGYLLDRNPLRVSSFFISPFDLADFLLIPLALVIERIARGRRSPLSYVLCAVIVAALFASRVRADALAAVILAVVALAPAPSRPVAARFRLLAAILVAAAVVVPSLGGTRFVNAQGGASSNRGHINELTGGLHQLLHNPLGIGIGNVAGVGDRFVLGAKRQGGFTVDNSVLQVADELGIQAVAPWLAMTFLVWRALGRAARRRRDPFAGGVRLAFLALFVAGMYHHVFLSFTVAWVLWAAVGLALPSEPEPEPEPATTTSPVGSARPMELRSYAGLLRQRLVLVILTVVAAVAGAYLATNRTPVYRARATIYVGSRQPATPSGTPIVQLDRILTTYASMVTSAQVAQGAIAASHLPRSAGEAVGETTATVLPKTNLIAVSVTDPDPAVARALADGIVASFVAQVQDLTPVAATAPVPVSAFEPATPGTRRPTGLKKALALGAIFGFIVSVALVLLLDHLDVGIDRADDLERQIDLPVLGTVPLGRPGSG